MGTFIIANLINPPEKDPGVYIEWKHINRAVLFDMGDLSSLSPRQLLKVSHIFLSHLHIDHFIGFDQFLRIHIGREKHIHIYGPPGLITQVRAKLRAYTWNLVGTFAAHLTFSLTEIYPRHLKIATISSQDGFRSFFNRNKNIRYKDIVFIEENFQVVAVILDHKIPSIAYAIEEKFHLNINKDALKRDGIPIGPWLRDLKDAMLKEKDPVLYMEVPLSKEREGYGKTSYMPLGELQRRYVLTSPGEKIAYVADALFSEKNVKKILKILDGANIAFIEAAFLQKDIKKARDTAHLTAAQAGYLARKANVNKLIVFHFSPRYEGMYNLLEREARLFFRGEKGKSEL